MIGRTREDLAYTVMRSDRRSLGLTIERNGVIVVRVPHGSTRYEIERFVSEKGIWIQQKLNEKELVNREGPKREFVNGQGFLYLGRSYRLRYVNRSQGSKVQGPVNGRALRLRHGYFDLDEREEQNARSHFVSWYTRSTEEMLRKRIPRYDKRVGVEVEKVRVTNLGHRWASHSRNGAINFNWRSVMTPIWVLDYILVHEMVHMIERKHSIRFWQLISRVIPDYEEHVRWLRENGPELDL